MRVLALKGGTGAHFARHYLVGDIAYGVPKLLIDALHIVLGDFCAAAERAFFSFIDAAEVLL